MEIYINSIPHHLQRYPTTGDWRFLGPFENLHIDVSRMGDWRYEFLIGAHEMIEAALCKQAGIKEADVSHFDELYETCRPSKQIGQASCGKNVCGCAITETSEPGDDIHAPYYKQHQLATAVERMLAAELGVSWQAYEDANNALYVEDQKQPQQLELALDTPGGIASKAQEKPPYVYDQQTRESGSGNGNG